jgi:nicotinamidase-related amidase
MKSIRGLEKGQKTALVISECQNGMTNPAFAGVAQLSLLVQERNMISRLAALIAACRAASVPVIHCTIVALPGFAGFTACSALLANIRKRGTLVAGNPAADIHPDLAPMEGDIVVQRSHGVTGFHGTELEPILRGFGVETVILAGVSTNVALPGMCTEAVNRGFSVVLPEDCTAGGTAESHDFQIRNHLPLLASITDSERLIDLLRSRYEIA